jgi:glycosyltransferase involved in cell wall biosynthesis
VKVLLLTDIPPSANYTAGLVLAQACRMLPHGSIACFSIVNPELPTIELAPDLKWLPMEFVAKPRERAFAGTGPLRRGASYVAEEMRCRIAVPNLVNLVADFAQRQNVDTIWAVLQGQTMVRVAAGVADRLNLPLHTQVWDPLSWWLDANAVDGWHKKQSLAQFDEVMKRSKSCATASWAMSREYETRYGVRCVPLIASHARDEALHPEPKLRRDGEVVIGVAGQFYADQEWQQLVQALNSADWKVDGREVRIKVLGHYVPSAPIPEGRCEFLGWKAQKEAIRILSEETDILYCPYPSQPSLAEVTKLSFPSKLVTYFAAGRPVLFHGPDFASPAQFLADRRAGLVVVGKGAAAAYNGLVRLVTEPDLYAEIARNAQNAFEAEFTLEKMKSRLLDFLGTTDEDLLAAPAARVAFDPTSPAASLPRPPVVRSRRAQVRELVLYIARRTPVVGDSLADAISSFSEKRALAAAARLNGKPSLQTKKTEPKAMAIFKWQEMLTSLPRIVARPDASRKTLLAQQKIIETELEKFIQVFDRYAGSPGNPRQPAEGAGEPLVSESTWLGQRQVLEAQLEGTKRAYAVLADDLHDLQRRYDTMLAGISARLAMMEWGGTRLQKKASGSLGGVATASVTARYLDLLEACLTGTVTNDASISPWVEKGFNPELRFLGRDWPEHAQTMIGTVRMRNVRFLLEKIIADGVPGDVIETGVWRGGACIYMRAILLAHDQTDRTVWVADSFAGLPPADEERYPVDSGDIHHTFEQLAISLEEVQANFERYGLLDPNVRFLKGWFKDTLPSAPIERLALLRLDGDMYSSTIEALDALYHKVSPGGFVIVDDFILPPCRKAVEEFRARHGINDALQEVDGAAVYWQKSK